MEELLTELSMLGILIEAKGASIEVLDPNNKMNEELLVKIKANKSELLTLLNTVGSSSDFNPIPKTGYSGDADPLFR